jgi:23S rRNA pseudouridine1911/1915/1917 synthase
MTGRLHQIRAHLQAAGWPIVGDSVYGGQPLEAPIAANSRPPTAAIDRQALHAWRLSLPHPVTGEILHVEASVPDDMQRLIDATFSGNGVPSPGGDARGGS